MASRDVQIVAGYALHRINFGVSWDDAIRWAMDKLAIAPARRGGVSAAVRNALQTGTAISALLNTEGFGGTLGEALSGREQPAPTVGVRVNFQNPTTKEWKQQIIDVPWGMTLDEALDIAYESLLSHQSGGDGYDRESAEILGSTYFPKQM